MPLALARIPDRLFETGRRILGLSGDRRQREMATYEAAEPSKKRRKPTPHIRHEDKELDQARRQRLLGSALDARRNFPVLAWACRRHLDFVCKHSLRFLTPDAGLNRELRAWFSKKMEARNFDLAARHDLESFARISEALYLIGGDSFWHLVRGGKVQGIEGDRIRDGARDLPKGCQELNGVVVNEFGRAISFTVHKRHVSGGYSFERSVPARYLLQHGYFDRFDQVRGVSAYAPGMNSFVDAHEGKELARNRAKVAQAFGMVVTQDGVTSPMDDAARLAEGNACSSSDSGDASSEESDEDRYDVDVTGGGFYLELKKGEDAKFLHETVPSTEFQAFMQLTTGDGLKANDLPYSFYDESHTNFFGSKNARDIYLYAAKESARRHRENLLYPWTRFVLFTAIAGGELDLGGRALSLLAGDPWEWVQRGFPWWDPEKESKTNERLIGLGLRSRTRVVREMDGEDWEEDVVPDLEREQKVIGDKKLWVSRPDLKTAGKAEADDEGDDALDEDAGTKTSQTKRSGR